MVLLLVRCYILCASCVFFLLLSVACWGQVLGYCEESCRSENREEVGRGLEKM
jgi:hypothetical protein